MASRRAWEVTPEILVLWEKTKRGYKGSVAERARQFVAFIEEYPGKVLNALEEQRQRQRRSRRSR